MSVCLFVCFKVFLYFIQSIFFCLYIFDFLSVRACLFPITSIFLLMSLSVLSVCMSVCLSVYLSVISPSIIIYYSFIFCLASVYHLFSVVVCLPIFCLSVSLFDFSLSIYFFVCLLFIFCLSFSLPDLRRSQLLRQLNALLDRPLVLGQLPVDQVSVLDHVHRVLPANA